MISQLAGGIVGVVLYVLFLGIMLIWVPAPPLIAVVAIVTAMMLYDFIMTLRFGEDYGQRNTTR